VARRRGVEAGHRTAFEVEILSGLCENEGVIIHPSNLITDSTTTKASVAPGSVRPGWPSMFRAYLYDPDR
jgi:hypothetical protein